MRIKENSKAEYTASFYCYFGEIPVRHYQKIKLSDIPAWINAYQFTHPDVTSISVKVLLDRN